MVHSSVIVQSFLSCSNAYREIYTHVIFCILAQLKVLLEIHVQHATWLHSIQMSGISRMNYILRMHTQSYPMSTLTF